MQRQIENAQRDGISLLSIADQAYPKLLKQISDPPAMLWVRGELSQIPGPDVAIVGTRRASPYGRRTAHRLAFQLASKGVRIVSGLAYGIDAAAHHGAIDAGGQTVAVLGSGVDQIYPREHRELASAIEKQGCVISELDPNEAPEAHNFPVRNRIISGLCRAVIVVEAFERAGALITSRSAIDQNRDVYFVPGRIDEQTSKGTNISLLRGEGQILCSVEQVLDDLRTQGFLEPDVTQADPVVAHTEELRPDLERKIIAALRQSSLHIDELDRILSQSNGSAGGELWVALLNLECDGAIRSISGNRYEISSRSAA